MQNANRPVAIGHIVDHHAKGHDVGDLLEADMALGHLLPDGIGVLLAAPHLHLQPSLGKRLRQGESNLLHLPAASLADLRQPPGDGGIGLRLQLLESQQVHLAHIFIHTHPLGQGGIDFHGFAGDAAAFFRAFDVMQRAHVVQPVGQLDQQHPQILAHCQEEFAQVFGGALLLAHRLDLRQLGHAIDQPGDIGAEQALHLIDGGQRVFHRVVQQGGDDRVGIELQLGHQARHLYRMAEIGVTTGAFLRAVLLHGVDIGAVQQALIRIRIIGKHAFNKFILAQHAASVGDGGGLGQGERVGNSD